MTREEAIANLKANYPDACFEQLRDAVDTAISALKQPEIVRCKDCKHLGDAYTIRQGEKWCTCSEIGTGTELNGWCWYGERRDE